MNAERLRSLLVESYREAVASIDLGVRVARALEQMELDATDVLAVGKGAPKMAEAATKVLTHRLREVLVVTTPQQAAAEVAERAGSIAVQTHQKIVGVVENMSGLPCPHCGEMVDVFGTGGGRAVADALTRVTGAQVPVLAQVPIDPRLRQGGDDGIPLVLSDPDAPAARQLAAVAQTLASRSRGLAGRRLGLTPV